MTNLLNKLNCTQSTGGNTGLPTCIVELGIPGSVFLGPKDQGFTESETADESSFLAALAARAQADNRANRGFFIGSFENAEPIGEDRVQETAAGSGRKRTVRAATIGYRFTIWNGGKSLHTLLYKAINGRQDSYNAFINDSLRQMWGRTVTTNGVTKFEGYSLTDIYVSAYTVPTGQAGGMFTIDIFFAEANEMNMDFACIQQTVDPRESQRGFIDVTLKGTSSSATALNITAFLGNGNVDLHDTISAALAQVGVWKVYNAEPGDSHYGNAITVSAVTNSSTGTGLTLAATGTDPDNPGTGKKVRVTWDVPSALAALTTPVVGLEAGSVTITLA